MFPTSDRLTDPIRWALATTHRHLALGNGRTRRYGSAVGPFAAVEENTSAAMSELRELLAPDEAVFLAGERPVDTPGLKHGGIVPCLQMLFPADAAIPEAAEQSAVEALDCRHAGEMMELIAVAYPGYFRAETCRMGEYYGIREGGQLVAMGGERLVFEDDGRLYREISGLCSHPEQAGKGLGTALLLYLLRRHRETEAVSWLWVVETNRRAVELYHRLGFVTLRHTDLHRLVREDQV